MINDLKKEIQVCGLDISRAFSIDKDLLSLLGPFQESINSEKYISGLVFGNSRFLWDVFVRELSRDQVLQDSPDPLDMYIKNCIERVTGPHGDEFKCFYSHEKTYFSNEDQSFFPIQRVAEYLNFSEIRGNKLSFHSKFGYWFSFRGILFSKKNIVQESTESLDFKCGCHSCSLPFDDVKDMSWREHYHMRSQCPFGKKFEFSKQQALYHYTGDRIKLMKELGLMNER